MRLTSGESLAGGGSSPRAQKQGQIAVELLRRHGRVELAELLALDAGVGAAGDLARAVRTDGG